MNIERHLTNSHKKTHIPIDRQPDSQTATPREKDPLTNRQYIEYHIKMTHNNRKSYPMPYIITYITNTT